VAKAGYEGIEISPHHSHLHPFDITKERLNKLKELFARLQIKPVSLALGDPFLLSDVPFEPSLISPDEKGRKKRISLINTSLEIANYLSIPVVNFQSGIRQEGVSEEEATQMLVEGVRECLKNTGDAILALEPDAPLSGKALKVLDPESPLATMGPMFVITTSRAIAIIREIDSPSFRLTIDTSHVQCVEPDLLQRVTKALPYARHIHMADIRGREHYHEIPGEAEIDFPSLFKVIRNANYQHYISVELYWHSDVWEKALYQSRKYLLEQMKISEGKS